MSFMVFQHVSDRIIQFSDFFQGNKNLPINEMPGSVHLTERDFVVIPVVQNVHQIRVEWVHFLKCSNSLNEIIFMCFKIDRSSLV